MNCIIYWPLIIVIFHNKITNAVVVIVEVAPVDAILLNSQSASFGVELLDVHVVGTLAVLAVVGIALRKCYRANDGELRCEQVLGLIAEIFTDRTVGLCSCCTGGDAWTCIEEGAVVLVYQFFCFGHGEFQIVELHQYDGNFGRSCARQRGCRSGAYAACVWVLGQRTIVCHVLNSST